MKGILAGLATVFHGVFLAYTCIEKQEARHLERHESIMRGFGDLLRNRDSIAKAAFGLQFNMCAALCRRRFLREIGRCANLFDHMRGRFAMMSQELKFDFASKSDLEPMRISSESA